MKLDVNHYPSRAKTGRAAYCVDTRYVLEDGEQKYFATKQEAHAYIARLEDELQLNTDGAWDWTFYDLLGFEKDKPVGGWVKHLQSEYDKGKISKSSWSEKHRHAKYFLTLKVNNKSTAQLKVRDLEMKHVQLQLLDQMAVGHTKKTVKNILTSLRAMNRYAILIGCRKTDPWQGAVAIGEIEGKATDGKVARVQPAVVKSIIGVMDPWWALMATFASSTGLRQGEQRALTWADLDLDGSKVEVNKAVKHRADVGPPKSPKGYRKVTLPRGLAIQLRELYIKRGRPAKTELVFPTRTGAIISDSRFQENMDKACAKAGVEKIRWHDLRHYYASQLLRAFKNDWWTITNLMGHESVQTTQKTYGHWIEDEEKDAHMLDAVSSIFE